MVFHPTDARAPEIHCTYCGRWMDPQLALCPPCRTRWQDDRLRHNQAAMLVILAVSLVALAYCAWAVSDVRATVDDIRASNLKETE